ncbi:hypothetical protein CPB86DRAFT_13107 [Serendipita vermifera]|nr:hypothetical protein CPB86DRAFT_13107 [Serendipita vermifera]
MFQRLRLWDFHSYRRRMGSRHPAVALKPSVLTMSEFSQPYTLFELNATPTTLSDGNSQLGHIRPSPYPQGPSLAKVTPVTDTGAADRLVTGGVSSIDDSKGKITVEIKVSTGPFPTKPTTLAPRPKFGSSDGAVDTQTQFETNRDLSVHYAQDEVFTNLSNAVSHRANDSEDPHFIKSVKDEEAADLGIALESGRIAFDILDKVATEQGVKRIPHTIRPDIEELYRVLVAATHYFSSYHRKPPTPQKKLVTIEFMKLQRMQHDENDSEEPANLVPCSSNMINDRNSIELVGDDETEYGIRITNLREQPLYVSVFYFDHFSLQIMQYYPSPGSYSKKDSYLESKGMLEIGYGSSSSDPWGFSVSDGLDVEVGFLKFFISTERLDLSGIAQPSPFSEEGDNLHIHRGPWQRKTKLPSFWDTIVIPVVIRRSE